MNSKVTSEGSKLDTLKWLVVVAIVAVGVVGNSIFSGESLLYRVLALLVLALVAGFVAFQTAKGRAFFQLFKKRRVRFARWSGPPVRRRCRQRRWSWSRC